MNARQGRNLDHCRVVDFVLARRAIEGPITHIPDWWHISMRVKHIENVVKGLLQTEDFSGLTQHFEHPAETRRWNLWHGQVMTAATSLKVLIVDCDRLLGEAKVIRAAARRVKARCQDLYTVRRQRLWDRIEVFVRNPEHRRTRLTSWSKGSCARRANSIQRKRRSGLCWRACVAKRALPRCGGVRASARVCTTRGRRTSLKRGSNVWPGMPRGRRHQRYQRTHCCRGQRERT